MATPEPARTAHTLSRYVAAHAIVAELLGHDLRSPLQAASGCADLLGSTGPALESQRLAAHLGRACDRMVEMLEGAQVLLQDVERPLDWRPVDLAAELAGAPQVRVVAAAPVPGDPALLRVLLDALVDNALQHGGAPVEVTASVADGAATLEVSDGGPAFRPEHAEALFRPFLRQGPTAGAGLGLTRARRIVEDHGGTITATARPDGATFTARWPLQPPWEAAAGA